MRSKYEKIRNIIEYFLAFCICGWIYESVWCEMIEANNGFVNHGFLFGPWLPIYGFGMIAIVFVLKKLKVKNGYLVFLLGTLIATIVELIGSYIMEFATGGFLWDYSSHFLNFQGRIALQPDLMFGVLTLIGMKILLPKLDILQNRFGKNILHNIVFIVLFVFFLADVIARIWLGSNI